MFTFEGNGLRIIGAVHANMASRIHITIDGYRSKFSARDANVVEMVVPQVDHILFEKQGLKDGVHVVEIELGTDEPFVIQGIQVSNQQKEKV